MRWRIQTLPWLPRTDHSSTRAARQSITPGHATTQWPHTTNNQQWWAEPKRDWDLNSDSSTSGDSIRAVKIRFNRSRFDSRFDLIWSFWDSIKKESKRDKSAACLQAQNGMHELSKHFCFGCNLMLKLHHTNWMTDTVLRLYEVGYVMCD